MGRTRADHELLLIVVLLNLYVERKIEVWIGIWTSLAGYLFSGPNAHPIYINHIITWYVEYKTKIHISVNYNVNRLEYISIMASHGHSTQMI